MKGKFKNIGLLVKKERTKIDTLHSQSQLSKILGYKNGQFISNVERGMCSIPLKSIPKLSEVLKIDPDVIVNAIVIDTVESIRADAKKIMEKHNG